MPRTSRPKFGFSTICNHSELREFRDRDGDGATKISNPCLVSLDFRYHELRVQYFRGQKKTQPRLLRDQRRDGATFAAEVETAQLSGSMETARHARPKWRRRCVRNRGVKRANFETKIDTVHLSRSRRRRRDFLHQGGDGVTEKKNSLGFRDLGRGGRANDKVTKQRANHQLKWRLRYFRDQCGGGAIFLRRRQQNFPGPGRDGATNKRLLAT